MCSISCIICLLDDEPCVLKAVGRLLAAEGYPSEKFSNPILLLEYARTNAIGLAVIDIRMPGMSGIEVLATLREESPSTQVIVITGEDNSPARELAMAGGAYAFFLKPFEGEDFLAAVRRAVSLFVGHPH